MQILPDILIRRTFTRQIHEFRCSFMSTEAHVSQKSVLSPVFHQVIRFAIAPLALSFSGFHITDFLLSGVYSWPRTSRVIAITFAIIILSYEFVYKESMARHPARAKKVGLKVVLTSCVIPFMIGSFLLVFLLALSH